MQDAIVLLKKERIKAHGIHAVFQMIPQEAYSYFRGKRLSAMADDR